MLEAASIEVTPIEATPIPIPAPQSPISPSLEEKAYPNLTSGLTKETILAHKFFTQGSIYQNYTMNLMESNSVSAVLNLRHAVAPSDYKSILLGALIFNSVVRDWRLYTDVHDDRLEAIKEIINAITHDYTEHTVSLDLFIGTSPRGKCICANCLRTYILPEQMPFVLIRACGDCASSGNSDRIDTNLKTLAQDHQNWRLISSLDEIKRREVIDQIISLNYNNTDRHASHDSYLLVLLDYLCSSLDSLISNKGINTTPHTTGSFKARSMVEGDVDIQDTLSSLDALDLSSLSSGAELDAGLDKLDSLDFGVSLELQVPTVQAIQTSPVPPTPTTGGFGNATIK